VNPSCTFCRDLSNHALLQGTLPGGDTPAGGADSVWAGLASLTSLDLSNTNITGTIPPSMADATGLASM
jgi:hypothetical protein